MVEAQVTETFRCAPDDLLEFVMDIERYAEVDDKIRPIDWARRDGNHVEFKFRPRMRGMPPSPKWVQHLHLTPGERVDVTNAPLPHNRLTHPLVDFSACWVCTPAADGTRVVRTIRMGFKGPFKQLAESMMAKRLRPAVEEEIRRAKEYLENRST